MFYVRGYFAHICIQYLLHQDGFSLYIHHLVWREHSSVVTLLCTCQVQFQRQRTSFNVHYGAFCFKEENIKELKTGKKKKKKKGKPR